MISGIYFNEQTRSFALINGEGVSSSDIRNSEEYKNLRKSGKSVREAYDTVVNKLTAASKAKDAAKLQKHLDGVRNPGKRVAAIKNAEIANLTKQNQALTATNALQAAKLAKYNKNMKTAGIAAAGTLAVGGAALAAKKIIDKRKADKAAAEKKNA
jgi:hypothetical protein